MKCISYQEGQEIYGTSGRILLQVEQMTLTMTLIEFNMIVNVLS